MSLINNPRETLILAKDNLLNSSLELFTEHQNVITKGVLFIGGFTLTSILTGDSSIFYYYYWFLLGVLSTIGFGVGLPTGTLFLIPTIINNYNTTTITETISSDVFWKSLPIVLSWGIGTAIGELPPYFLARYNQKEYQEYVKDYSKYIGYLKKNSFVFIAIGSSWPNVTFDFVGMLCGLNDISVFNFIIPTIIGKAFIKAPFQLLCVIYFYSELSNNKMIITPPSYFAYILNIIFSCIIVLFIKKTIETLADNELKSKLISENK